MEFFNRFIEIENQYNFFGRKYNNINYWEYVRSYVYVAIWEKAFNLLPIVPPYKRKLSNYKISLKNLKHYFLPKNTKKLDVLILGHPRRYYQDGAYENPYADPIEKILLTKYNCLMLEEPTYSSFVPTDQPHLFPLKSKNIVFTDLYEIKYNIKKILLKTFNRNEYENMLNEYSLIKDIFIKEFNNYDLFGVDFKYLFLEAFFRIKLMYTETERMISKLNPRLLIVHYFPTVFKTMIINICNKKGIKTIEIQHGTVSDYDPIHSKFKDYKILKSATKYFFGFGEKNVETTKFHTPLENIKYVGCSFLENKLISNIKKPDAMLNDKKYILIISQSLIGDKISAFTSKLAEKLKDHKEYVIIFKYHPLELSREYPELSKDNIIQIKDFKNDIYSFQKYSIMQIGVSSTALYEGIAFQLPTIILKNIETSQEAINILDYISTGVYIEDNFDVILSIIIDKKHKKPLKRDVLKLWVFDSSKKVLKEVGNILNEND